MVSFFLSKNGLKKTFAENKNSESSRFMKDLRNGYYKIIDKIVHLKQNSLNQIMKVFQCENTITQ